MDNPRAPLVLHARVVTGNGGGPEKTILNSCGYLPGHGYDTICAYMHPPGDPGFELLGRRAAEAQATLVAIPDRGPWDWKVLSQFVRLCRKERPVIWHGHDYKSNLLGLLLRRFWPMELVSTVHGWGVLEGRMPVYNRIDRLCLRFYRAVVCVSEDLYGQCQRAGVPPDRCYLIPNAIDTAVFRRIASPHEARQHFGASENGFIVGAMGRLSGEKGFDLLIRAVDRLIGEGCGLSLWIAGEGPARAELEDQIRRAGRGDRIRLLGHVADPRRFFEAIDLFALSSFREGLPNVLLEAMAMQTPVLATRVAGVPSLVRDGENGLLCNPGSLDQLAAGIRRLANDAELRLRLAQAGRQTVEQSFSFARRMEKVTAIYDHVLNGDGNARRAAPSAHVQAVSDASEDIRPLH